MRMEGGQIRPSVSLTKFSRLDWCRNFLEDDERSSRDFENYTGGTRRPVQGQVDSRSVTRGRSGSVEFGGPWTTQ